MTRRERFYLASLLWAALLILPASAAWAADANLDRKARDLDRGVPAQERTAFFSRFSIPNAAPYNTLPPGQALVLSSLCGSDLTCAAGLWSEHQAGKGWGEIAKERHVKLGPAVKAVTDAHRDLVAKEEHAKPEKLEKAEKMERVDRPMRPERPGR